MMVHFFPERVKYLCSILDKCPRNTLVLAQHVEYIKYVADEVRKAFPDRQSDSTIRDRPYHTVTFIAQVVQNVSYSAFSFVDFKGIPALFAFLVGLCRFVNGVVRFFRAFKVYL